MQQSWKATGLRQSINMGLRLWEKTAMWNGKREEGFTMPVLRITGLPCSSNIRFGKTG